MPILYTVLILWMFITCPNVCLRACAICVFCVLLNMFHFLFYSIRARFLIMVTVTVAVVTISPVCKIAVKNGEKIESRWMQHGAWWSRRWGRNMSVCSGRRFSSRPNAQAVSRCPTWHCRRFVGSLTVRFSAFAVQCAPFPAAFAVARNHRRRMILWVCLWCSRHLREWPTVVLRSQKSVSIEKWIVRKRSLDFQYLTFV